MNPVIRFGDYGAIILEWTTHVDVIHYGTVVMTKREAMVANVFGWETLPELARDRGLVRVTKKNPLIR